MSLSPFRLVFGVIGDDIHVVANRVLEICICESGIMAVNLGTNNSPESFVDAACEIEAHAVLVSSLNGEGEHWCNNFRKRFDEIGREDILLYIGGNLVIGDRSKNKVIKLFTSFGFNRVFFRETNFNDMIKLLIRDLSDGISK